MKMKKILFGLLAISSLLVACGKKEAPADAPEAKPEVAKEEKVAVENKEERKTENFHIGIVTPTVSQSEDSLRGAEAVMKEYGAVKDGGKII
ncbi:MAG: DUF3798 domain-containing protein, partial [Fusobacterium sp.]|nr:DUF3798 domain-containing protein [Fusobacterium sp.]